MNLAQVHSRGDDSCLREDVGGSRIVRADLQILSGLLIAFNQGPPMSRRLTILPISLLGGNGLGAEYP